MIDCDDFVCYLIIIIIIIYLIPGDQKTNIQIIRHYWVDWSHVTDISKSIIIAMSWDMTRCHHEIVMIILWRWYCDDDIAMIRSRWSWWLMIKGTLQPPSSSALPQAQPHRPATIIIVVIIMMRNQMTRSIIIVIIITIIRKQIIMLACCWQEGRLWLQLPASLNLSRPLGSSTVKDHHHHHRDDDDEHHL